MYTVILILHLLIWFQNAISVKQVTSLKITFNAKTVQKYLLIVLNALQQDVTNVTLIFSWLLQLIAKFALML